MSDPTGHDALAFWLAHAHPALMVVAILLSVAALRAGLALRRARRPPRRGLRTLRDRHLRLAKPAVLLLCVGFLGGPLSMWLLRGRTPFGTAHAWVAILALALFVATAIVGRRLERGRGGSRDAHALLGVLGVLLAALAFATGFVLLP